MRLSVTKHYLIRRCNEIIERVPIVREHYGYQHIITEIIKQNTVYKRKWPNIFKTEKILPFRESIVDFLTPEAIKKVTDSLEGDMDKYHWDTTILGNKWYELAIKIKKLCELSHDDIIILTEEDEFDLLDSFPDPTYKQTIHEYWAQQVKDKEAKEKEAKESNKEAK